MNVASHHLLLEHSIKELQNLNNEINSVSSEIKSIEANSSQIKTDISQLDFEISTERNTLNKISIELADVTQDNLEKWGYPNSKLLPIPGK